MKLSYQTLFDKVLKEVQDSLPEGYKCAVVGGAVRDSLLGIPFKDVNVCIIPPCSDSEADVEYVANTISLDVKSTHGFRTMYDDDTSDFNERLVGCVKIDLDGIKVDLLFQREFTTFEKVVKEFDHVANMVYYDKGKVQSIPSSLLKCLILSNKGFHNGREIRECRIPKMDKIMKVYGQEVYNYLGVGDL